MTYAFGVIHFINMKDGEGEEMEFQPEDAEAAFDQMQQARDRFNEEMGKVRENEPTPYTVLS